MARRPKHPALVSPDPAAGSVATGRMVGEAAAGDTRRRGLWPGLALIRLLLLAYYPAIRGGFFWDDDAHLTANLFIVGPLGLSDIWTSARMRMCPLVQFDPKYETARHNLALLRQQQTQH